MLFRCAIIYALVGFAANQVAAAAVEAPRDVADIQAPSIATDRVSACNCPNNCPNNCRHKAGSSCKFYTGPSDTSKVFTGTCQQNNGQLQCQ